MEFCYSCDKLGKKAINQSLTSCICRHLNIIDAYDCAEIHANDMIHEPLQILLFPSACSSMPSLRAYCSSNGVTGYAVVRCFRTNNIASITCSIDGGEEENCTLPLTLTAAEVGLGEHTVAFTLTDVCGDTAQDSVYISWNEPLPPPGKSEHHSVKEYNYIW